MLRIADLKYKTKLSLIAAAAILGIVVVTALSFGTLNKVKIGSDSYNLLSVDKELEGDSSPAALGVFETRRYLLMLEEAKDAAQVQNLLTAVRKAQQSFEERHEYYLKHVRNPKLLETLNGKVYTLGKSYFAILNAEYIPLVTAGKIDEAKELRHQKMAALADEQESYFDEFGRQVQQIVTQRESEAANEVSNAEWLTAAVGFAVLLGVGGLVWAISRHINAQIGKLLVAANSLADGDMTHRIDAHSKDELGEVGRAMNTSFEKVGAAIAEISRHSETVANASEEISSSAGQVSSSTELQRQQMTQIVTAMVEMSSTVTQVSDNSQQAAENMLEAGQAATEGGKVVDETIAVIKELASSTRTTAQKIEELGKSSDSIGKIIGTIDDIADQTNLLALNAAIEAARAGEQGRGFAVVADEVRKLAERTSSATKEIAGMIETIQHETKIAVEAMRTGTGKVDSGVEAAGRAGDVLKEIISATTKQHEMITHIATAATEQAAATDQVNGNMELISKMVQQSAISAEESAKACQDLSSLALDLQQVVSKFKVEERSRGRGQVGRKTPAMFYDPSALAESHLPVQ
jgi:methyl-accepting chemotaxis protein